MSGIRPVVWACAVLATGAGLTLLASIGTTPETPAPGLDPRGAPSESAASPAASEALLLGGPETLREIRVPRSSARPPGPASLPTPATRREQDDSAEAPVDPAIARELFQSEFAAARAAERLRLDERLFGREGGGGADDPAATSSASVSDEERRRQLSDELVAEYLSRSLDAEAVTPDGTSSAEVAARARENARYRLSQTTPALRLKLMQRALGELE